MQKLETICFQLETYLRKRNGKVQVGVRRPPEQTTQGCKSQT